MKNKKTSFNSRGFTLIELMIVLSILGILAAIAYPQYVTHVQKSKRADAINSLVMLAGRMEEFYMGNDSYTGTGSDVATLLGSNQSLEGHYTIAIDEQTAFGYTLSASPNFTDTLCDTLTYDSLGVKGLSGTFSSTVESCW